MWPFILVSALLETMTSNVLRGTVRASRANGSESNYRGQGDPVGKATLMILFHKTEVLPSRYMNPGRGLFQRHIRATQYDSVFIVKETRKKNTDSEEETEKRQRGERPGLLVHATVFFHTL